MTRKSSGHKYILFIVAAVIMVILAACSTSRKASEGTTSLSEAGESNSSDPDKPGLIDESGNDEESFSRALAMANQTRNKGDAGITETADAAGRKKTPHKNYTLMVYMTGSDLEERYGSACTDLKEMMESGLDYDRTNLIVYTGGARKWNMGITSASNNVLDMSLPEEERRVAATEKNSDMGSPDTLTEFLNYTADHYPADHYALIFWDHGGGSIYGYGKDTLYKGDSLLLWEMKQAMDDSAFAAGGKCRLDWVGFDACLMATLENAVVWKDYTDYLVASEELESGDGWDYSFLELLNDKHTDTLTLCKGIVDTFTAYYEEKRTASFHPDITLSVMDLSKVKPALDALNDLTGEMIKDVSGMSYADIVRAHSSTKTFGLMGDERGTTFDLLDVRDLADRLAGYYPDQAGTLRHSIDSLVAYRTTRPEGAFGVSMYFPGENKELYTSLEGQNQDNMFASEDFRRFTDHYADRWLKASDADWKLGQIREEGDELLLQLTEDQAANLADAGYSILLQHGKGEYVRAMSRIRIEPDINNVLHIPRDPDMIYVKGTRQHCSFVEESRRNGQITYSSQAMTLDYDVSPEESVFVTASLNDQGGKLSLKSVKHLENSVPESGKTTVNLSEYSTAFEYLFPLSPAANEDGTMKPYYNWTFNSDSFLFNSLDYVNDGIIEFEYGKTSQAKYPAVLQILVRDINGQDHASDIFRLGQGTKEKERVISLKTDRGRMDFLIQGKEAALKAYEGQDERLELPPLVEGYPLRSLGEYSITSKAEKLKELTIPEGVKTISEMAIDNNTLEVIHLPATWSNPPLLSFDCSNLRYFDLAESNPVFSLKDGVLFSADGKKLLAYPNAKGKKYKIPDGTLEIGSAAFAFSDVEEIIFPDSLERIDTIAFFQSEQLKSLDLPDSITYIGNGAFASWFGKTPDLNSIKLGSGLTFIGEDAFDGLKFHAFDVAKGNSSFSSKNSLLLSGSGDVLLACPTIMGNKLVVPSGVTALQPGVFSHLSPATVFVLPDSLYRMSKDDFPKSLYDSGEGDELTIVCSKGSAAEELAFRSGFKTVYSEEETPGGDSGYDRILPVLNGRYHFQVYSDHAVLISYEGGDSTLSVPDSVDGKPVTEIGDGNNRINRTESDLQTDSFALGVKDHVSLTEREKRTHDIIPNSITLPDTVKRINKDSLSLIGDFESSCFELPSGLEYISPMAFGDDNDRFNSFSISEDNKFYTCIDGVLFSKDKTGLVMFPKKVERDSAMLERKTDENGEEFYYQIPDGIKFVDKYAFSHLNTIEDKSGNEKKLHILFPSSLESIESKAFYYADLHSISLNEGLTGIREEAFSYASVTDPVLKLPDSVKEIDAKAFERIRVGKKEDKTLYGFKEIYLSRHLKSLGSNAFALSYFQSDYELFQSPDQITIPEGLRESDPKAFVGLELQNYAVNETNRSFSAKDGLLLDHEGTGLISVPNGRKGRITVPEGVTSIGPYAFAGCHSVTEVQIPDSVKSISNEAFKEMEGEEELTFICSKESFAAKYADNYQYRRKER